METRIVKSQDLTPTFPRDHTGSEVSNYKFTDQELDPESGLYNYDARLYDPMIGRFISADSTIPDQYNPQSLNRYSYCYNNPLIYTDPSGYITITTPAKTINIEINVDPKSLAFGIYETVEAIAYGTAAVLSPGVGFAAGGGIPGMIATTFCFAPSFGLLSVVKGIAAVHSFKEGIDIDIGIEDKEDSKDPVNGTSNTDQNFSGSNGSAGWEGGPGGGFGDTGGALTGGYGEDSEVG